MAVRGALLPELDAFDSGAGIAEDAVVSAFIRRRLGEIAPAKVFLEGRHPVTYGQIGAWVARFAALFAEHGVEPGGRVLLALERDDHFAGAYVALIACGMTAVPLDPEAPLAELAPLARMADPAALIAEGAIARALLDGGEVADPRLVVTPERGLAGKGGSVAIVAFPDPAPGPAVLPERAIPLDRTALILFTSGTTSRPKGVELTFGNLLYNLRTLANVYGFDAGTRVLNAIPLHHSDGCTHGALLTFICGATLVRPGSLSPASLIDSLGRVGPRGVSHWIVTPTILRYLSMVGEEAKSFLGAESFRFLISTGAYLPEPQWREFEERFGRMVVNVYGLTETVAESVYCGPSAETRRLGTIGKPIDAEAKIVDAEGRPVPPGTPGELCLKGRHIMKGYFRNPEETEKVLRDGWLFTGDIVSVDEDGFYRIVGRKKNIIIVAGLNVHPEDVTDVIRTMPGVADAVTFGLPDEVFGERVVSCVQRRRGTQLDPQDVRAFCMTMMVSYKLPRDIFIVDDMPRGPVGKVQIEEIKKAVLGSREDHHELPAGTTCSAVGVAANVPTWQGRPAGARAGARGRQGSGP